jgi:hypothetical protein
MTSPVPHILTLGSQVWSLFMSTVGCFMFMRGFRLLLTERDELDTIATSRAARVP